MECCINVNYIKLVDSIVQVFCVLLILIFLSTYQLLSGVLKFIVIVGSVSPGSSDRTVLVACVLKLLGIYVLGIIAS